MKLDRTAFLAFAAALSAAACSAPAAEDSTDDALAGDACTNPRVDNGVYPAAEACYQVGENWGQCAAWTSHFEAGIARKAVESVASGTDSYQAGFTALRSTCVGTQSEETRLAKFCGEVADLQLASPDKSMNIRTDAFGYRGSTSRLELLDACKSLVRGVRLESRALIKRCIKNEPSYPVYACVEGLGFDDIRAKCVNPDEAVSDRRDFDCGSLGQDACETVKSLYQRRMVYDTLSCVEETQIIRSEAGTPLSSAEIKTAIGRCGVGILARSCVKEESRPACASMVEALKTADPELGLKGHINAGGSFAKRCTKILSGLSEVGRTAIASCVTAQASRVKDGAMKITDVSIDRCVVEAKPARVQ